MTVSGVPEAAAGAVGSSAAGLGTGADVPAAGACGVAPHAAVMEARPATPATRKR